jgi:hypothetical protein
MFTWNFWKDAHIRSFNRGDGKLCGTGSLSHLLGESSKKTQTHLTDPVSFPQTSSPPAMDVVSLHLIFEIFRRAVLMEGRGGGVVFV